MFEAGKEYKTRRGLRARVYDTDAGGEYPIHGAVIDYDASSWTPRAWSESGHCQKPWSSDLDLMPPVVTRKVWLNIYEGLIEVHNSKEFAEDMADLGRIAFIEREITFTPGEGLDK